MLSTITLTITLLLYGLGTLAILLALIQKSSRFETFALLSMVGGLISHTIWIATICIRTGHPPLTNLPETTSFIAWSLLSVQLLLSLRFRIPAAGFFVYPIVFTLMIITALVHERYQPLDASLRSNLFIAHLLLSTLGVAALLLGLGFALLYRIQDRALSDRRQGPLYDWIPSLQLCDLLSYRALAIGFTVYTLGLLAGILWSYRTSAGPFNLRAKEIAALAAWLSSAVLLQAYVSGSHRTRKAAVVSAATFICIIVALFGIRHV